MKRKTPLSRHSARAARTHAKARNTIRPRLVIYRSNRTIYGQLIDDAQQKILCSASGLKSKETGIKAAEQVGAEIAEQAKKQKVTGIVFDRNGYKYHGQVKALADAARKAGLKF
ncbi:50S ribosomal protein L18 [Candidatus Gracilibacteria bacterium]|nr:50S ribosomal protein L18 [Candidatus Gracilibacteria bacterium]MCF7819105.1 50S ribosomal protein L18 [Candidatus Gracilibacteria bacterium]